MPISYKESIAYKSKEEQFLDTIDLLSYIKPGMSLLKFIDDIEGKFGKQYTEEPCIFNNMDRHDFAKYLHERYPSLSISKYIDYILD